MEAFCYKTGKAIHESSANAQRALKRLGNSGSTYLCPSCNGYHHSSMTNSKREKGHRKYMFKIKNLFNKYRKNEISSIQDDHEEDEFITTVNQVIEQPPLVDTVTGLYMDRKVENDFEIHNPDSFTDQPISCEEEPAQLDLNNTGNIQMNNLDAVNIIDRSDRFTNRNKPVNHDARSILNQDSKIVQFINQKHYEYGFHTGFNYGSLEAKNIAVEQIIGEFRLLVSEAIQMQLEKRAVIQHHLLSIKELPHSVEYAQFNHAISESDRRINDLNNEIVLSNRREGIIKKAISQYETGYQKGYREYLDNSDLLCN